MIWWPRDRRPWAVFGAALLASTFLSWDLGYSLLSIEHSRGLGLLQWAACYLAFLWACNARPGALDPWVRYGGGGLAALAVAQRLAGVAREHIGVPGAASPVLLGELLVVAFPVAWRLNRWLAGAFMLAAGAAQCRSASLAMLVMMIYLLRGETYDLGE